MRLQSVAISSGLLCLNVFAVPTGHSHSIANPPEIFSQPGLTAPAALDGVVTDSLQYALSGVEILADSGRVKAVTNSVGAFHLAGLPSGPVTFTVRKIGYGAGEFTLQMEAGVTRYQTIVLRRLNNVLSPIVVEESPVHQGLREVGFYERSENARGTFLTPEILATRSSTHSSDFLLGVNGVQITSGSRGGIPFGTGGYMAISDRRNGHLASGYCVMNVYLDGVRTALGTDRGGEVTTTLDDMISASDVGAIEVYPSGVTSPQQYTGVARGCGTILIWSKVKLNSPNRRPTG
jgi:hypothetical protein